MKARLSLIARLAIMLLAVGLFVPAAAHASAIETSQILLHSYDFNNVGVTDQDGGGGYAFGRHETTSPIMGGNNNIWLPIGNPQTQDIRYTVKYPQPLTVDKILFNSSDTIYTNGLSRIEYTTDPAWTTGWTTLVSGVNNGAQTFLAGTSFTATQVTGLRWVLPKDSNQFNAGAGGWNANMILFAAYGTNSVLTDNRYDQAPRHATFNAGNGWTTINNPAGLNNQDVSDYALRQDGALPTNAFVQMTLDGRYAPSMLMLDWYAGAGLNGFASSYDIWVAGSDSNFVQVANNHITGSIGTGTQDKFFFPAGMEIKYVLLNDFQGSPGGTEIIREMFFYGEAVPEPSTALLLAVGGLVVWRRCRMS